MENISWSDEQIISIAGKFKKAMEDIWVKFPDFQHASFVNTALIYLKHKGLTRDWKIESDNEMVNNIFQYLEELISNISIKTSVENDVIEFCLKDAIQNVFRDTLSKIPQDIYSKGNTYLQLLFYASSFSRSSDLSYVDWENKKNNVIFIKGLHTCFNLIFNKLDLWENTIVCDLENIDNLFVFCMFSEDEKLLSQKNTIVTFSSSNKKNQKFDYYIDYDFDFSKTSSVMKQLKKSGKIIAGVTKSVIDGDNNVVRNLIDEKLVTRVKLSQPDKGWIEVLSTQTERHTYSVDFYSPDKHRLGEKIVEDIAKCNYSLDYAIYDVFEKVDAFTGTLDSLYSSLGPLCPALKFFIPFFKKNYKDVVWKLTEEIEINYKELVQKSIDQNDNPEKTQMIHIFFDILGSCLWDKEWMINDANYQQSLNAIRIIDVIDDDVFHKYYPDIIKRISKSYINKLYMSQYQFIESQLKKVKSLKFEIRKANSPDIFYPGDGEDQSTEGWGSLITPMMLNNQNFDVKMSFTGDDDPQPVFCTAIQYIILDAFNKKLVDINKETSNKSDVIIDLHKDVRQYENVSAAGLNYDGTYVTFVMKKDLETCLPVIERLVKDNILDKVISLNNRYLLFISQNKHDNKISLAKFNHIDDDRWMDSYQTIIDELALNTDTTHVKILSSEELATNNYSISTDYYFPKENHQDIESILHSIIAQHRGEYDITDILLNVLSRISFLHGEGKPLPIDSIKGVKKLGKVFDTLKEYEELLMENYVECVNTIISIYSAELNSFEYHQPEIAKLMVELINADTIHDIYNPFAGLATFACLLPNANYYGEEININRFTLGAYRLIANGLWNTSHYKCGDSTSIQKGKTTRKYDTILSIPPFLEDQKSLYDFLFEKCMSLLEDNGKMLVVLPMGFTFNGAKKIVDIRKNIVENQWIEKVISLPGGAFRGTNVNTCIIQLSKSAKTKIMFCDATQMVEYSKGKNIPQFDNIITTVNSEDESFCFYTDYCKISKRDYSLNPIAYKPFPKQEGMTTYKLGDLMTIAKREQKKVAEGLVLNNNVLSSDVVDYRRSLQDMNSTLIKETMIQLQGNVLLISSGQGSLRPTYVDVPQDTLYFVNRNLFAFNLDTTKVLPAYICYALSQPEVLHQIDNYRAGVLINSEDFLNVWINVPDISTQRNTVDDLARQRYAEKKQELTKMYGTIYTEKEEEFKSLKHAMGKSVAGISAAVDNLYNYFAETGQLDTIVHKRRASTLGEKLNVIQQGVQHIAVLLKHGADFLDVSQYPMGSITIDNLWNCIAYETDRFMLNKSAMLDESIRLMTIKMNIDLFRILVNDILSNAEKHAFENNNPVNTVRVEYAYDNSWFTLFISNNGQPFPVDVDVKNFTKRYWSAGNHQGSGIGGHDILKIMTAFQGEFELLTDYEDFYPTCYVLRFPVE